MYEIPMIGYYTQKFIRVPKATYTDLDSPEVTTFNLVHKMEGTIMIRPKPKREKQEQTIEEFVKRINQQGGKRNGLKRRIGHHHGHHPKD